MRVVGGFNPFDFAYRLKPGETLETPVFYGGYSGQGMGGASRLMHRFEMTKVLPEGPTPKLRPILYNSWEATEFAVDEKGQMALAEKAARIGVERFVMDDGWFGARNNDHAGLGDWTVNRAKFPGGTETADRQGARPGHGIRLVGRTGNGQSRQQSVSRPSRLGDEFSRAAAFARRAISWCSIWPARMCATMF